MNLIGMNEKEKDEKEQKGFPEQITKDNFPELVERAKNIKKRAFWFMIVISILYALIGLILVIPLVFFLAGWFLKISFPELSGY